MGGWWAWLISLLGLFVTSLCISENNEIYVWNKIALINESNDGKYIVIKLSLSSISVPEDKEKRFDYNICEALNDNRALSEIDIR